ncbi:protein C1orf43 homolog [Condylostylus longicornis]|uniref:protein C1orf43 homolog n=1 Tax=Condylostylus longicornis TaxID=2530218 RepID=UPI00244E0D28|nr:protein C1orf43 homolog [Condylostylus longicornis]
MEGVPNQNEAIAITKMGNEKAINEPPASGQKSLLPNVMIIAIIGGGVLIFVILFLFAKRQIMRFTLRSRRGPHAPVGNDANKSIRREIERRLDCIQKIAYEPKLLWDDDIYDTSQTDKPLPPYYYRMRAVDDVKILEKEIIKNDGTIRHPRDSLRAYLLTTLAPPLNGAGQRMIHQFMDMYEHARHDPNEFGSEEYDAYHRLLMKLIDAAKMLKSFSNSRKASPSRTPLKKQPPKTLLDPSRLRPPPLHIGIRTSSNPSILGVNTKFLDQSVLAKNRNIQNSSNTVNDDDNKSCADSEDSNDIRMIDDITNNEINSSQRIANEINEVKIEDVGEDVDEDTGSLPRISRCSGGGIRI